MEVKFDVRRHKMLPHFSRVPSVNSITLAGLLLGGFLVFLLRVVRLSDHRQQLLELLVLVVSALSFLLLGFHLLLTLLLLSHQHHTPCLKKNPATRNLLDPQTFVTNTNQYKHFFITNHMIFTLLPVFAPPILPGP